MLDWCGERDVAVVPVGGGTSVVGGIDARPGPGHAGVVAVNLRALDRVLEVDPVSRAARIQAGATGPRLEEQLAEHGLTLRFYPQSFELATLGGWIATRAGGHFASGPTHIDDLVESVRALTVGGDVWESRRLPGSGAGPSPDRMLLGSEGTLAVDHRGVGAGAAAARAAPLGERVVRRASRPALDALRELLQAGLRPANCRLLERRGGAADAGAATARARCSCSASRRSSSRPTARSRSAAPTAARSPRAAAAARARGARRSCARPTCATRSPRWGC